MPRRRVARPAAPMHCRTPRSTTPAAIRCNGAGHGRGPSRERVLFFAPCLRTAHCGVRSAGVVRAHRFIPGCGSLARWAGRAGNSDAALLMIRAATPADWRRMLNLLQNGATVKTATSCCRASRAPARSPRCAQRADRDRRRFRARCQSGGVVHRRATRSAPGRRPVSAARPGQRALLLRGGSLRRRRVGCASPRRCRSTRSATRCTTSIRCSIALLARCRGWPSWPRRSAWHDAAAAAVDVHLQAAAHRRRRCAGTRTRRSCTPAPVDRHRLSGSRWRTPPSTTAACGSSAGRPPRSAARSGSWRDGDATPDGDARRTRPGRTTPTAGAAGGRGRRRWSCFTACLPHYSAPEPLGRCRATRTRCTPSTGAAAGRTTTGRAATACHADFDDRAVGAGRPADCAALGATNGECGAIG